MMIQDKSIKNA